MGRKWAANGPQKFLGTSRGFQLKGDYEGTVITQTSGEPMKILKGCCI
jgi:hypothetical protein